VPPGCALTSYVSGLDNRIALVQITTRRDGQARSALVGWWQRAERATRPPPACLPPASLLIAPRTTTTTHHGRLLMHHRPTHSDRTAPASGPAPLFASRGGEAQQQAKTR
jgi:hypothetical protein